MNYQKATDAELRAERIAAVDEYRQAKNATEGAPLEARIEAVDAEFAQRDADARYLEAYAATGYVPAGSYAARSIDPAADKFFRSARRDETMEVRDFGTDIERRFLSKSGGVAAGGETVPTSIGQVVESRIELSGLVDAGLTVLRTTSGENIKIPISSGRPVVAGVNEAAAFGKSNGVLDSVEMGAEKIGLISQASVELLADSASNIVGIIGKGAGNAFDLHIEEAITLGAADGVTYKSGVVDGTVGKTLASNTALTAEELIDAHLSLPQQYRRSGVWMLSTATIGMARKLKGSDGQFLWATLADGTNTLLGAPVMESAHLADLDGTPSAIVGAFLDPASVTLRIAGGLRIERSDQYAWDSDLVSWKFASRIDVALTDVAGCRTIQAAAA